MVAVPKWLIFFGIDDLGIPAIQDLRAEPEISIPGAPLSTYQILI
jgi:hypothetical protein